MEYLLIVGLTLIASWSILRISNKRRIIFLKKHRHSQSSIYEMIKNIVPKKIFDNPKAITQSEKHIQKNMLKVLITEGKAYWILDNVFYTANAINGRVDEETIEPLNVENMSIKELNEMLSILDDLKQGVYPNDSSSTGDKRV